MEESSFPSTDMNHFCIDVDGKLLNLSVVKEKLLHVEEFQIETMEMKQFTSSTFTWLIGAYNVAFRLLKR